MVAVAQARCLLADHHGGGGASALSQPLSMARGRWSQDGEGWRSRQSRAGGNGNWRSDSRQQAVEQQLREEKKKLQQQVREFRAQAKKSDSKPGDVVAHPNAREGPPRHGDWQCVHCQFKTNRYSLEACHRCAVSKSFSFPSGACSSVLPVGPTPISLSAAMCTTPSTTLPAAPFPTSTTSSLSSSLSSSGSSPSYAAVVGGLAPTSCGQTAAAAPAASSGLAGSNGATGPGQPALVGPEGIKALKGQLERLLAAKAQLAADPLLAHVSAGLDAQIQGVRMQLSSAQPVEVALRGTLGAVSNARQSLTKAEQKAAKLETQVVAAVAAYEAAALEVQTCKKALADAEEATARTAGGRFDPRLLMGAHPGAALAVLAEAAAARCVVGAPGVDTAVIARVQAAFQEVQAACRILPADVPVAAVATSPEAQSGRTASGGITGGPQGSTPSAGDATIAGASSSPQAAAVSAQHQQQQQQQHQQQHQQQQTQHQHPLQQQAIDEQQQHQLQALAQQQPNQHEVAAELARQHAQAALAQASQQAVLQSVAPPSVASPAISPVPEDGVDLSTRPAGTEMQGQPTANELVGPVVSSPVPVPGPAAHHHHGLERGGGPAGGAHDGDGRRRDDDMGGGASDSIVNKRTAAEAIESARVVAAKAKARAS